MSFTVNDLHDMIEIIENNPVWKTELRKVLLGEDFLGIREMLEGVIKELRDSNRRYDERFGRVETRMDAIGQDVDVLKQDVSVLKQDVSVLKQDVSVLKQDVTVLKHDVSYLKGSDLERRIRERPHIYLGKFIRRARTVADDAVFSLLDEAVTAGRINRAQADDVERLDVLVEGKALGGDRVYLAIEITGVANTNDTARAIRRAQIIQTATLQRALPVVCGKHISPSLQAELDVAGGGWAVIDPTTLDVA